MYLYVGVNTATNYPGAELPTDGYPRLMRYESSWDTVYREDVDSNKYGQCDGFLRRSLSGGEWSHNASGAFQRVPGSRCILAGYGSAHRPGTVSIRGCNHALYYRILSILPIQNRR